MLYFMLTKVLVVFLIGALGGLVHRLLFEKKLYLPKMKEDEHGRYLDLGFLKDIIIGVVMAFIATAASIMYVPVFSLIITSFLASISGKFLLKPIVRQFIQNRKESLQTELQSLQETPNSNPHPQTLDQKAQGQ